MRHFALLYIFITIVVFERAHAQTQAPPARPGVGIPQTLEAFKGITASGEVETNLFQIKSTGVSTEPIRVAAEAFLAGLT